MKSKKIASGYRLIFGYLGIFLILIGIICLLPFVALIFPNCRSTTTFNTILSLAIPSVCSIVVGLFLYLLLIFKREKMQLGKFQDAILLVLIWISAILICSVPFMLSNGSKMSFTEAVFESTSGFSTTGLTLFFKDSPVGVEFTAFEGYHLMAIFRAIIQLFGGVGLVLIVTSALSDRHGLRLYTAEGHNDKLMPNLAKSARLILAIYLGYILVGTLAYVFIAGIEPFDAFCHATAALATGGFSTRPAGLIEITNSGIPNFIGIRPNEIAANTVSCVLMLLGATNFVLHLFIFRGKFKDFFKDCEIKFFGLLIIIFIPIFFAAIMLDGTPENLFNKDPIAALGHSTYLFISSISTTGFSSVGDINTLGKIAVFLTIITMTIGGGMGSTAGSIKQYRFIVVFKSLYWSIRDKLNYKGTIYPHYVNRLGKEHHVSKSESFESFGYILLYITIVLVGTVSIMLFGKGQIQGADAMFEFVSSISGTGISDGVSGGIGYTGINLIGVQWTLTLGMFAGRLEIYPIYFALYRSTRDMLRKETL